MTAFRAQFAQVHIAAGLIAIASAIGLASVMSATDGYLETAMQQHNARLEAISERAERIEMLSRHIRKASLTNGPDVQLPFGGHVGSASRVEPGARLKLGGSIGAGGQLLEIVTAQKVAPTIDVATDASQSVDLMLVTGRSVDAPSAPLIRFLVAVTPENPATAAIADQRSL